MSMLQNKHPLKTFGGSRLLATYGSLSLRPNTGKRKSAVEMLQETKAFYVKSERVLDARQQLQHADHLQVSPTQLSRPGWLRHPAAAAAAAVGPVEAPPLTPPPTPPKPTGTGTSASPQQTLWSTPEKPPPLPARSPGCRSSQPRTRTPPGSATPSRVTPGSGGRDRSARISIDSSARAGGEKDRSVRASLDCSRSRRSGDSVQARLRKLLTPSGSGSRRDSEDSCDAGGRLKHKSLPDISGGGGGGGGGAEARLVRSGDSAAQSDEESGSGSAAEDALSRSYRSRGRATSDYVSRSPASALTPSDATSHCWHARRRDAFTDDGVTSRLPQSPPHRPVTRSKSDVSHKYGCGVGGGGGLRSLGLWTVEPPPASLPPPVPARPTRRGSRGSAELGRFFDQLGMDGETFRGVARVPSDHWSPVETPSFWDGLSAGSSRGRRVSNASEGSSGQAAGRGRRPDGGCLRAQLLLLPAAAAEPSIVEKNARIVKWLFHVRKAQEDWLGVS